MTPFPLSPDAAVRGPEDETARYLLDRTTVLAARAARRKQKNGLVAASVLKGVIERLERRVGPQASDWARLEIEAMGVPLGQVPEERASTLVGRLCRHIQDAGERDAFFQEARALLTLKKA